MNTTLAAYDIALTTLINSWAGQSAWIDEVVVWITSYGIQAHVLSVAFQWWPRQADKRHVLVATGFSFLLGLAFNQIVLLFVHRVRPYDMGFTHLLIERSADYSFPSDHATASMAIAITFALNGFRGRAGLYLGAALILSLSRIYVGTHYVTDIIGGTLTALLAALLVNMAYRKDTKLDAWLVRQL